MSNQLEERGAEVEIKLRRYEKVLEACWCLLECEDILIRA